MGVKYSIPENAEVISSIGVALAMVRDVVERIIPSPSKEDIRSLKNEAMNKAIESGATPESIEVHVEIDPQTSKVTAIATGSTEVKATDLTKEITTEEALELAAEDMRLNKNEVCLLENTPFFYVCGEQNRSKMLEVFGSSIKRIYQGPTWTCFMYENNCSQLYDSCRTTLGRYGSLSN